MRRREIGGIKIGRIRFWSLAYADNVILIAKNRKAIQDMMSTLKEFRKNRQLGLNVKKSKVVVFNRKDRDKKKKSGSGIIGRLKRYKRLNI